MKRPPRRGRCYYLSTYVIAAVHLVFLVGVVNIVREGASFTKYAQQVSALKRTENCGNLSTELIEEVRKRFVSTYHLAQEEYDERDMNIFLTDCYIQRYLVKCLLKVDETVDVLHKMLKWRKSTKLSLVRDDFQPAIFRDFDLIRVAGRDLNGNPLLFFRLKYFYKSHAIFREAVINQIYFNLFKVDELAAAEGTEYTMLVDFTGVSSENIDFKIPMQMTSDFFQLFPIGSQEMYPLQSALSPESFHLLIVQFGAQRARGLGDGRKSEQVRPHSSIA